MGRRLADGGVEDALADTSASARWAGAPSGWLTRLRHVALGSPGALPADMNLQQFEHLLAQAYRLRGYKVSFDPRSGVSSGLLLVKGSDRTLVHTEQWRARKVGIQVIRDLYGIMAAEGAIAAIVVTEGDFTAEAMEFAIGRHIQLINGPTLAPMLENARGAAERAALLKKLPPAAAATKTTAAATSTPARKPAAAKAAQAAPAANRTATVSSRQARIPPAARPAQPAPKRAGPPAAKQAPRAAATAAARNAVVEPPVLRQVAGYLCPNCRAPMVKRQANGGPHAGTPFLGCSRYPDCRGVVSLKRLRRR